MTYYIYALENTKAQLCARQLQTNDKAMADYAAEKYEAEGFIVNVKVEG